LRAAVIVPTYNRPARLGACLAGLAKLESQDFEVIVVDDGGEADLTALVTPYAPLVRLVRQRNGGPAKARNAGVQATEAGFITFTDDDCVPEPGWLEGLLRKHREDAEALIGGRVENLLPQDVYASTSQSLADFLYDFYGAEHGGAPFFTSNNIGCDRQAFLSLGGFDETFPLPAAEDRDLGLRWRASGRRLVYADDAVVGHAHGMNLQGFWRQHSNYGRGAYHLHSLMKARHDNSPRLEGLGFYSGLIGRPLRSGAANAVAQTMLLGLSQLAMVSGYLQQKRATRPPSP
jgi:GT2 family glycosyltransferase